MLDKRKILEMKGISKHFGSVKALENVDFELYESEIVALVGSNGAGKSTLAKIISGVFPPDKGEMWVFGQKVAFKSPYEARGMGIETIYQDLALFDNLDIMANIFAAREICGKGLRGILGIVDKKTMFQESKKALEQLGIEIDDYSQDVKNLSGGQRQSIAISKAIHWGHRIIIMDEPTAALGVQETEKLMQLIRDLKKHDVSIIVIMHNIEQVIGVAERAVILRRGVRVGEVDINALGPSCRDQIVQMMI